VHIESSHFAVRLAPNGKTRVVIVKARDFDGDGRDLSS